MEQNNKNRDIEDILNSVSGMSRAVPSTSLFAKIEARLHDKYPVTKVLPLRTVTLAAASLLLLVAINVYMVKAGMPQQNKDDIQSVVNYYGLTDNTYGI